jgi:hypothetical protein
MENYSLQSVISQIKHELLSATNSPEYPLFLVEKLEIEVAISIKAEGNGGIKIQVIELGGNISREQCNKITITLSPILSREEQRELITKDPRLLNGIERASAGALRKGDIPLAGEPE